MLPELADGRPAFRQAWPRLPFAAAGGCQLPASEGQAARRLRVLDAMLAQHGVCLGCKRVLMGAEGCNLGCKGVQTGAKS